MSIDELRRKVLFYLFPQKVHVDVDDVGFGIEVDVPDVDGYIDPGHHLVPVSDKVFEELKFLCSEGDVPPFAGDFFAIEVHNQIGDFEDIGGPVRVAESVVVEIRTDAAGTPTVSFSFVRPDRPQGTFSLDMKKMQELADFYVELHKNVPKPMSPREYYEQNIKNREIAKA